jgi:hypothetical protein
MEPLAVSPKYASIETWLVLSGMCRRATYYRLASGDLTAIKFGRRTLVDIEASLAWLRSHPPAEFHGRPPRGRCRLDAA